MDTPKQDPKLLTEQVLELLSEHIASNDRVANAVGSFEKNFPTDAERVLADHRSKIPEPALHAPTVAMPTAPTQIQRSTVNLLNLWGLVIVVLIVGCSCTLLYFQLSR